MHANNQTSNKKPYQRPTLVTYGNIRELTMNSSTGTKNFDNYSVPSPNNKTNAL